ncbi:YhgE/Pip domain-containing protein [Bacillus sp. JJ722]|uniref:YhgE/Pip domain-containing protein n=1 Tax=Bacillus sp. JJ722 TaxID=3122973 RepID=UPI002FFE0423
MSLLKNKMLISIPIITLIIIFIFSLAQIPSAKQAPKNLPIAIVNEDTGMDIPNIGTVNLGNKIVDMISKKAKETNAENEPAIKWISVSNYQKAKQGMDNQEYYGALVIPKDFSLKQASLQTPTPSPSEINIYVNQGMNAIASNTVTHILNEIVDNINKNAITHLLEEFKKQNRSITAEQASILASPITKNVNYVNQTGTQGNTPIALFQPLWMASIVGAALIWVSLRSLGQTTKTKKMTIISIHVLIGAICALVIGFGLTGLADGMLGFAIPSFMDTALFLTITSFSFILMIVAVLMWLGVAGLPIFVLLLFFGAPLLAMAPEFMPSFYQDWVITWLPMRFMIDGLRELFFFGKELSWNDPTSLLIWIGIGSLLLLFLSTFKPDAKQKKNVTTNL